MTAGELSATDGRVGDGVGLLVHGDVKVDPDEDALALERDVLDALMGGQRACCSQRPADEKGGE